MTTTRGRGGKGKEEGGESWVGVPARVAGVLSDVRQAGFPESRDWD